MAFGCSIPHQLSNPNLTFKNNNGSKLPLPSFPSHNPRNPSLLSSSCSFGGNAHGLCITISYKKRKSGRIECRLNPKFVVRCSAKSSESEAPSNSNSRIIFWSAVTLVLAVGNRVMYKLALVPMKEYPFFLAQLNTFGVYRSIDIIQSWCANLQQPGNLGKREEIINRS